MTSNYVQRGNVLNFTAAGAVAAGAVVELPHCLGVALSAAADSGDVIAVAIEGVFTVPKVSAAVFEVGEKLTWDTTAGAFDDAAALADSGDLIGAAVAVAAGSDGETSCTVKLTPRNVTKTP